MDVPHAIKWYNINSYGKKTKVKEESTCRCVDPEA